MSKLYDYASRAVANLYSDTSISSQETLDLLRELQVEIEDYISALQSDIANGVDDDE